MTGAPNLDFVERSLASLLYPAAATAFRSPGFTLHGEVSGGVFQWWAGAFNGKGILTNNTTNEPEVIGRLRFSPWKKKKDSVVQGLAFGGSIGHGRSRGLSSETSFSGVIPEGAYTFFPSFRINGPVERYEADLTWLHSRWAVRLEYDQLDQFRRAVGSDQFTFGLNWYLNYWIKYQVNVSVDRLKEPSVGGQEPQNFTVLLNRLQFRF